MKFQRLDSVGLRGREGATKNDDDRTLSQRNIPGDVGATHLRDPI